MYIHYGMRMIMINIIERTNNELWFHSKHSYSHTNHTFIIILNTDTRQLSNQNAVLRSANQITEQ